MSWSVKLAKRLDTDSTNQKHRYIRTICQIAIGLCITTVLISSFMIRGFEQKIEEKIFNFWAHIRVFPLSTTSNTLLENPIAFSTETQASIKMNKEIVRIIPVVNKGVILKSAENIEGIILKGIDLQSSQAHYNFTQAKNLPYSDNEVPIILSMNTLNRMDTRIGHPLFIHIIDSHPRILRGRVINSYFTNIEEFDNQIALSELHQIQKMNHWNPDQVSWLEIYIRDLKNVQKVGEDIYQKLQDVNVESIFNLFPQMFDWLALMKRNELIILIVMQVVAIINVMSTISIFILEKTPLIGMLKVLGAKNRDLYLLLYYQIGLIILKGIIFGNLLAMTLTAIVHYLKPIKLDPTIYYIDYAPVAIDWGMWVFINGITILVCILSSWIPLRTISNISPVKVAEYK
jgi:lipoprotein-releasing system permease protein